MMYTAVLCSQIRNHEKQKRLVINNSKIKQGSGLV